MLRFDEPIGFHVGLITIMLFLLSSAKVGDHLVLFKGIM